MQPKATMTTMVKLLILFKQPPDENAFEMQYVKVLAALEKLPGIQRRQANIVRGTPEGKSPYYRILEFYFKDFDALDAALTAEAGTSAGQELMSAFSDVVELHFVDVFEDDTPVE
jgi:uncharacterized protein (TIGR02118 family)